MKNLNVKITKKTYDTLKENGLIPYKMAEIYLNKLANKPKELINPERTSRQRKVENSPFEDSYMPEKDTTQTTENFNDDIYKDRETFGLSAIKTPEAKEIEALKEFKTFEQLTIEAEKKIGDSVPRTANGDVDWDKIKEEQTEEYGPKLTKKEKLRAAEEENIRLCKKFGKDPKFYSCVDTDKA